MSKAVICPICNGKGEIPTGIYTTAGADSKTCHGCGGLGWVQVDE